MILKMKIVNTRNPNVATKTTVDIKVTYVLKKGLVLIKFHDQRPRKMMAINVANAPMIQGMEYSRVSFCIATMSDWGSL